MEKMNIKGLTCWEPTAYRVMVLPDYIPDEEYTDGGIYLASSASKRERRAANQVGTIVAVGNTAWHAYDQRQEIVEKNGIPVVVDKNGLQWAKPGDRVLYTKYGGKFVEDPITKIEYVLLNDEDITGVYNADKAEFLKEAIKGLDQKEILKLIHPDVDWSHLDRPEPVVVEEEDDEPSGPDYTKSEFYRGER